MGRGALLWMLGVPLPIVLLLLFVLALSQIFALYGSGNDNGKRYEMVSLATSSRNAAKFSAKS
jgi:hypothetical protein